MTGDGARRVRVMAYTTLGVLSLHLVFGAIVRISGSGMGCGDHWPKCYGQWFPVMDRVTLIIEVSHRYGASLVSLLVAALAVVAWMARNESGDGATLGGPGGALRSAVATAGAVVGVALLGAVTVKLGNPYWATALHLVAAMLMLALLATTAIRAGGLGGAAVRPRSGTITARRGALVAASIALGAVALGGLTAKYPGAAVGCLSFPHCGPNPDVASSGRLVQLAHRSAALTLVVYLAVTVALLRKRRVMESPTVVRVAHIALALVVTQLVLAGAMIGLHLPAVLRSLHQATGVGIWLSTFTYASLASRAAK